MKHKLPELPYPMNALEPHMSKETLEYHYGKHHRTYVDKLNELIKGTEFEEMQLEEIIQKASGPIFNNAAQAWNHTFFWNSLTPKAHSKPSYRVLSLLTEEFSSLEKFQEQWKKQATSLFGSGWTWLTWNPSTKKIGIENTSNADNPFVLNKKPLLACDVWEHAYYIDYRNERPKFIEAFFSVLNWDFVDQNFQRYL